jgi:RimJ/RimL family protein N-acetyltransferase
MDPVEVQAGRFRLRPYRSSDIDTYLRANQDPDILRWLPKPSPFTWEHARAFIEERAPFGWSSGFAAPFAVADWSDELVGGISLGPIDTALRRALIGYWTAPWARGQGVATEAVRAICGWSFRALDVDIVLWEAEVGNVVSHRVAEKVGFVFEGTLRQRLWLRGERADAWQASLLPGELR